MSADEKVWQHARTKPAMSALESTSVTAANPAEQRHDLVGGHAAWARVAAQFFQGGSAAARLHLPFR
jgi:hypothetical protein